MDEVKLPRAITEPVATKLGATKVAAAEPFDAPKDEWGLRDADTGKLVFVAFPAPHELEKGCVQAFRRITRGTVVRTGGIRTSSNTFGYAAPAPVFRRNTPTASSWAIQDPEGHELLDKFAQWAWPQVLTRVDDHVATHLERTRNDVHPDWRIADTGWTGGIANDTVPLYYHRDRNNFAGSWSVMLAARAGIRGGDLTIADYGITVPIRSGWAYAFPGVDLMHGVTPIRHALKDGFRYTFVWYPVRAFGGLPGADEARHDAAVRRTTSEADQLARQRSTGLLA